MKISALVAIPLTIIELAMALANVYAKQKIITTMELRSANCVILVAKLVLSKPIAALLALQIQTIDKIWPQLKALVLAK